VSDACGCEAPSATCDGYGTYYGTPGSAIEVRPMVPQPTPDTQTLPDRLPRARPAAVKFAIRGLPDRQSMTYPRAGNRCPRPARSTYRFMGVLAPVVAPHPQVDWAVETPVRLRRLGACAVEIPVDLRGRRRDARIGKAVDGDAALPHVRSGRSSSVSHFDLG